MRILAFDTETSGLDPAVDRILELGWVLWDVDRAQPLLTGGGIVAGPPTTAEITEITAITKEDIIEFGRPIDILMDEMTDVVVRHHASWLVAHNAPFDMSFLAAALPDGHTLTSTPVIDTQRDIPFDKGATGRRLVHALADIGIVQHVRHRALMDALFCALLLQHYPIEEVIRSASAPSVMLRALVSYEQNGLAKARGYRWDSANKWWVKELKDYRVAAEQAEAPFRTHVVVKRS